tara:strand:+ start:24024 stop:25067 length:1044 start_codon:yes stop_codon:yes gene_type:complete
MRKKLLLCISFLMINALTFVAAQTGSVTIVSIQPSIEAGTSGAIEITYTSDVACQLNIQLRETNANLTTVNWSPWHGQMFVNNLAIAAVPTTVTLNYSIGGGQTTSANLTSGVQYTFTFKLSGDNSEGDFGYNDSQTENLVTVTAPSLVVNSAVFTSVPTEIIAGSDLLANFEYTSVNEGIVKVDIRKYDGDTWLADGLVVASFINPAAATTATAVADTKTLSIPIDTPISSSLAGAENYKTVVTLYDDSWGFIVETKSDLLITETLGINSVEVQNTTIYPNPVEDRLFINFKANKAENITISDITGKVIKNISVFNNLNSIDVSDLKQGMYILNTDTNEQYKFFKK